jgi:hypothetical protein
MFEPAADGLVIVSVPRRPISQLILLGFEVEDQTTGATVSAIHTNILIVERGPRISDNVICDWYAE